MPAPTLLALQQISHHFGALRVLDAVDLTVAAGEVHALLGENGAGKSTLMHAAFGMVRPDSGTVTVTDHSGTHRYPHGFRSPADARAAGIAMVHQHFTSIGAFSVAENLALSGGWQESGRAAQARATALIEETALPLNPAALVNTLNVSQRQRLEILKAIAAHPAVLLMDEPTAVLAPREVLELEHAIHRFTSQGGAVVLITHKLPEAIRLADRVTVLRRGRVVLQSAVASHDATTIARAMLGDGTQSTVATTKQLPADTAGEVLIRAEALTVWRPHHQGGVAIDAATFSCRAGEIVGIVALEGNGQHELLRAMAGVERYRIEGTVAVSQPVAFIPEDRTTEALIPGFSLTENIVLGTIGTQRWIDWERARQRTRELLVAFDVRAEGTEEPASSLSGGNQQKLVLARGLERKPRVLIAQQPSRGLDLRATEAIHQRLRAAAASGMAVVVHAADLDEVMALADRILVVANGTVTEMPAAASRDQIGDAMLGLGLRK